MPLLECNADVFARLTKKHGLKGDVCSIGRLWPIDLSFYALRQLLEKYGFDRHVGPGCHDGDSVSDETLFFQSIGFDSAESIDISDDESPTHLLDLNSGTLPHFLEKRYDLVYNNGTLEHIFNIPHALKNMSDMLREGGCVMHAIPINNMVDHGFYQLSPGLIFDYYIANGFDILESHIFQPVEESGRHRWVHIGGPFYNPYTDSVNITGMLDGNIYSHLSLVRKKKQSTSHVAPYQGFYLERIAGDKTPYDNFNLHKHIALRDTLFGGIDDLIGKYRGFLESIPGQDVIIWGASRGFETMADIFRNVHIVACIDNNKGMHGKYLDVNGQNVPICPPETLETFYLPLFICSAGKEAIYKQVKSDFPHILVIP